MLAVDVQRWSGWQHERDEYILDTPVVREFVAGVRETIAASASPAEACDAIRPRFAELLADAGWLPERYQEGDPESGMGGGIGQWLLFRAGDRSLTLFALVVPSGLADADPRPPRVGARRPLPRHPGRGDLRARRRRARSTRIEARALRARRLLRAAAAARRHPPRAHDLARDVGLAAPADQRHRLRVAPRVRRAHRRGDAVPLGLRQRGVPASVIHSARARARTRPSVLSSADAVWCLRPFAGDVPAERDRRLAHLHAVEPLDREPREQARAVPVPQRRRVARAVERRPHHVGRDAAVAVGDGGVGEEDRGGDAGVAAQRAEVDAEAVVALGAADVAVGEQAALPWPGWRRRPRAPRRASGAPAGARRRRRSAAPRRPGRRGGGRRRRRPR